MTVAQTPEHQITDASDAAAAVSQTRTYWTRYLKKLAAEHRCSSHPLFAALDAIALSRSQVARLLRNYDAHAAVLRRLLLKAATLMPEEAVGFILENVRNEYGNGNPSNRHELQLLDVVRSAGVSKKEFQSVLVQPGVKDYIRTVTPLYYPLHKSCPSGYLRAAISAGAVTATEMLAIREFESMQRAFSVLGLAHHIWFNHVTVEIEHCDESLDLALHFIERYDSLEAVEFGMRGVLDANVRLYDGLLASLSCP